MAVQSFHNNFSTASKMAEMVLFYRSVYPRRRVVLQMERVSVGGESLAISCSSARIRRYNFCFLNSQNFN